MERYMHFRINIYWHNNTVNMYRRNDDLIISGYDGPRYPKMRWRQPIYRVHCTVYKSYDIRDDYDLYLAELFRGYWC